MPQKSKSQQAIDLAALESKPVISIDAVIESDEAIYAKAEAAAEIAYNDVLERVGVFEDHGDALAAFLRVIAKTVIANQEYCGPGEHEIIREDLIDIASELEGIHINNQ